MRKYSNSKTITPIGEVKGVNHIMEFARFYDKHRKICDELSGMKIRSVWDVESPNKIIISRHNFEYAIKRLNSFVINNLHNIQERNLRDKLTKSIIELQTEFINDQEYSSYTKQELNHIEFTKSSLKNYNTRYLYYLLKCFEILDSLGQNLQKSLLITTADISKSIRFYDNKKFFENISDYRDEVSDNLSDLKYVDLVDHFKKITGYFYTYKYLISKKNQANIKKLISILKEYILTEETQDEIIKIKNNTNTSNSFLSEIRLNLLQLQKIFNSIYLCCNISLANKNILPKSSKTILIDKSLI